MTSHTPKASGPAVAAVPSAPAASQKPQIAFISGHIDLTPDQFTENYAAALDTAINRGDTFVLSNAGGVDTLALDYLRSHGVDPSRITIYMHTVRPNRKLNATQIRINKLRLGPEVEARYAKEGYNMKVIDGFHGQRDAAMTADSDYDILWVRDAADTALLYGNKYRPDRISGTEKNRNRRAMKEQKKNAALSSETPDAAV